MKVWVVDFFSIQMMPQQLIIYSIYLLLSKGIEINTIHPLENNKYIQLANNN